jgi:hypothetical protein
MSLKGKIKIKEERLQKKNSTTIKQKYKKIGS